MDNLMKHAMVNTFTQLMISHDTDRFKLNELDSVIEDVKARFPQLTTVQIIQAGVLEGVFPSFEEIAKFRGISIGELTPTISPPPEKISSPDERSSQRSEEIHTKIEGEDEIMRNILMNSPSYRARTVENVQKRQGAIMRLAWEKLVAGEVVSPSEVLNSLKEKGHDVKLADVSNDLGAIRLVRAFYLGSTEEHRDAKVKAGNGGPTGGILRRLLNDKLTTLEKLEAATTESPEEVARPRPKAKTKDRNNEGEILRTQTQGPRNTSSGENVGRAFFHVSKSYCVDVEQDIQERHQIIVRFLDDEYKTPRGKLSEIMDALRQAGHHPVEMDVKLDLKNFRCAYRYYRGTRGDRVAIKRLLKKKHQTVTALNYLLKDKFKTWESVTALLGVTSSPGEQISAEKTSNLQNSLQTGLLASSHAHLDIDQMIAHLKAEIVLLESDITQLENAKLIMARLSQKVSS